MPHCCAIACNQFDRIHISPRGGMALILKGLSTRNDLSATEAPMNKVLTETLKAIKMGNSMSDIAFCSPYGMLYRSFRAHASMLYARPILMA
jgi:hypothetical protein